ncbi:MAG: hypothetical protein ACOY93_00580 [Bacillota bacterium]
MLQKLQQVAREGTLAVTHAYLGHIKRDEERKLLAHADALTWDEVDPSLKGIMTQHLFQAIDGALGEVNFPCMYTGEVLSVSKVASEDFDRLKNRPAVEVLEAIREMKEVRPETLLELGNVLAYKVMAAGAIKNHLVTVLRFQVIPSLGAPPVLFSFATVLDLDDREESLFDEATGKFVTQVLHNVIKRGSVSRAVFFPCLDEDGREMADMLVYAGSGAAAWFKALEATRRLSPRREGQALLRMITEQNVTGEVPHDLFRRMGEELLDQAEDGLHAERVVRSLEKAVGHGVDRLGFQARWESTFGDLSYRPSYDSLFGGDSGEKPTKMKMQAGGIEISLTPGHLEHFRQVTVGDRSFILFAVPERARVVVGKELDLKIRPVELTDVERWIRGELEE